MSVLNSTTEQSPIKTTAAENIRARRARASLGRERALCLMSVCGTRPCRLLARLLLECYWILQRPVPGGMRAWWAVVITIEKAITMSDVYKTREFSGQESCKMWK